MENEFENDRFALTLTEDGRIMRVTYERFANGEMVLVDTLPEGNIADYRYVDGEYVYDPLPIAEPVPTQLDVIEAQVTYTAMMTDTLLEV